MNWRLLTLLNCTKKHVASSHRLTKSVASNFPAISPASWLDKIPASVPQTLGSQANQRVSASHSHYSTVLTIFLLHNETGGSAWLLVVTVHLATKSQSHYPKLDFKKWRGAGAQVSFINSSGCWQIFHKDIFKNLRGRLGCIFPLLFLYILNNYNNNLIRYTTQPWGLLLIVKKGNIRLEKVCRPTYVGVCVTCLGIPPIQVTLKKKKKKYTRHLIWKTCSDTFTKHSQQHFQVHVLHLIYIYGRLMYN